MKSTLKMRIVRSAEFEQALNACKQSFGLLIERKKVNVYIYTFDTTDEIAQYVKWYLLQFGSKYAGRCGV